MKSQIGIEADCPLLTGGPRRIAGWTKSCWKFTKISRCLPKSGRGAKILLPHLSHLYFRESVLKTTSTVLCGILVAGICSLAFCGNQTQSSPSTTVLTHEPYCLARPGWSRKGWFWQSVSRKEQLWNSCGRTLVFRTRVSVGEPPSHPNPTPCLLLFGHCHCHCFCLTGRGPFQSVFPIIVAIQTVIKLLAHFHLYTAYKPSCTTTIYRGSSCFNRFSIPIYPPRRDFSIGQKHLFCHNFWVEN